MGTTVNVTDSWTTRQEQIVKGALNSRENINFELFFRLRKLHPFMDTADADAMNVGWEALDFISQRDRANHHVVIEVKLRE